MTVSPEATAFRAEAAAEEAVLERLAALSEEMSPLDAARTMFGAGGAA